eukprot:TRINITY_DN4039_c0_g1_i1.p1 TRINITY_DN4039_c0_g1~~TRINITY_DN4039_c0_g1_i1.p1  ORF type:complete len:483 (+),score=64.93 TRINITY_DN4039_c0_g1_i1:117-1565(+)
MGTVERISALRAALREAEERREAVRTTISAAEKDVAESSATLDVVASAFGSRNPRRCLLAVYDGLIASFPEPPPRQRTVNASAGSDGCASGGGGFIPQSVNPSPGLLPSSGGASLLLPVLRHRPPVRPLGVAANIPLSQVCFSRQWRPMVSRAFAPHGITVDILEGTSIPPSIEWSRVRVVVYLLDLPPKASVKHFASLVANPPGLAQRVKSVSAVAPVVIAAVIPERECFEGVRARLIAALDRCGLQCGSGNDGRSPVLVLEHRKGRLLDSEYNFSATDAFGQFVSLIPVVGSGVPMPFGPQPPQPLPWVTSAVGDAGDAGATGGSRYPSGSAALAPASHASQPHAGGWAPSSMNDGTSADISFASGSAPQAPMGSQYTQGSQWGASPSYSGGTTPSAPPSAAMPSHLTAGGFDPSRQPQPSPMSPSWTAPHNVAPGSLYQSPAGGPAARPYGQLSGGSNMHAGFAPAGPPSGNSAVSPHG